jgi:hypothetical protein
LKAPGCQCAFNFVPLANPFESRGVSASASPRKKARRSNRAFVAELRILASERGVTVMEVKEHKLMLTRHGDFITLGGKFPCLTKDAKGRLKGIEKLLLGL